MDSRAPQAVRQFSQPIRQIVQMLAVLVLVGAGVWVIFPSVQPVVEANPFLNGMIALVFVVGVIACFLQVFQLTTSVRWLEAFAANLPTPAGKVPRLLAPLAQLLQSRSGNRSISSTAGTSILDSVGTRIEEGRDITRYLVSLLIFLGLLGTFYGLATVVPAVVETIRSLAPQEGEGGVEVFSRLMNGLEAQLGGMGTAFGSSLLGLAGSLVVGLLELFASRGQNRFYRELEEWLSSITRLGFAAGDGEVSAEAGAMIAVLDHMAEQMEHMQQQVMEAERARAVTDDKLTEVAMSVSALTQVLQHSAQSNAATDGRQTSEALERVAAGQEALAQMAEGQSAVLERLADATAQAAGQVTTAGETDAEARMRLRSIDVQLLRLLEEMAAGRQETVAELRTDLAALTREIRKAGRGPGGGGPAGGGGGGGGRGGGGFDRVAAGAARKD